MDKYAKEIAPWVGFDKATTWTGFVAHRWTSMRKEYGAFIAGTDDQIADIIEQCIPLDPINFNAPKEAKNALALHLVKNIEMVLTNKMPSLEQVRLFYKAYATGRESLRTSAQPSWP